MRLDEARRSSKKILLFVVVWDCGLRAALRFLGKVLYLKTSAASTQLPCAAGGQTCCCLGLRPKGRLTAYWDTSGLKTPSRNHLGMLLWVIFFWDHYHEQGCSSHKGAKGRATCCGVLAEWDCSLGATVRFLGTMADGTT